MRYIPHRPHDIEFLLRAVGKDNVDELFTDIPKSVCFDEVPTVVNALEEQQLRAYFSQLADRNVPANSGACRSFLGAGSYQHYIPAVVDGIAGRPEYYSSYTPYQAELSQGNLQVGFEFQSFIANLVDMDVANASMYDGANAVVEAVLMARRIKRGGHTVVVSEAIHPEYLEVLKTYGEGLFETKIAKTDRQSGQTDWSSVDNLRECFAVVVQYPNYFGCLEDLKHFQGIADSHQIVSIVTNNEPLAFAALMPPGSYGVDIFAGEAQSLGNPLQYGGPCLGILATRSKYLRNLPGRLVGKTMDKEGRDGYVLTLSTREQHIRREKATSNICTNQFLLALRATIYMAQLGQVGMRKVAFKNTQLMSEFLKCLETSKTLKRKFSAGVFNECTVDIGCKAESIVGQLVKKHIMPGLALAKSGFENCLLINFTELHERSDVIDLVNVLESEVGK